ncbi:hypothetical protein BN1184_BF_01180 [Pantoea ananatis]|nr:hypothetical protein BN1184_BF_01180 [Pantoea ananatis]
MPPFFIPRLLAKGDIRHLLLSPIGDIYLYDFYRLKGKSKIVLVSGDTFSGPDSLK